jgi:hypothetical protein
MCLVALVILQFLFPLRAMHFLATLLQLGSVYLIYCMLGNVISVVAPSAVSAGTMKPAQARVMTMLIHVFSGLLSPLAFVPAAVPLGIELALARYPVVGRLPIYFAFSLAELAIVVWIYNRMLDVQGRLLQAREQRVLEAVTASPQ